VDLIFFVSTSQSIGKHSCLSAAWPGHLPKHDDHSSRAWLYGKLLLALLVEKAIRIGHDISPWGYTFPRSPIAQSVA
jgi:hypothetical protein